VPVPADYQIIDPTGSLVSNSPYSRTFFAVRATVSSPYFMMWVKTAYSTGAEAASVRLNGTEIDKIWPRPWTNHNYIDLDAVPFIFSPTLLNPSPIPFYPIPALNTLEVVPVPGLSNYLFVHHVMYHSRA
jgi:hypothetical protein